jgi:hypothetical protein
MEVILEAVDNNGEPIQAMVKLSGIPPVGALVLIEAEAGSYPLTVLEPPVYTPAMGMRDPEITIIVGLIGEDIDTLREVMRCANALRTQEGPR